MAVGLRTLTFIVVLLAIGLGTAPAWSGFDEGLAAARRGDFTTALREWRPLAEQGNASAQSNLGGMYAEGRGVPQDYAEAVKWWRKAAEQGHAKAQNNLGFMYYNGQGVPRDYVQAHMWYNLAASRSPRAEDRYGAVKTRDQIAKRMTPAQISEAEKLAREWRPKAAAQGNKPARQLVARIERKHPEIAQQLREGEERRPLERAERVLERAEALRRRGPVRGRSLSEYGTRIKESGRKLAEADTDLEHYLTDHSNDVRALILSARIKKARISTEPITAKGPGRENIRNMLSSGSAHLNRALALEPNNAAIYYWKARHAWTEVEMARVTQRVSDPNEPVQLMRRAVELSPDNSHYREALATFLISSGKLDEVKTVLKEVAGGRHPIYLLLADFSAFPLPPGAVDMPDINSINVQMIAGWGENYPFARVRTYVLPMLAAQVEAFYQEAIPGLQFHLERDATKNQGKFLSTTVRIKGNQFVAVTRKEYLSNRKRGGAPKEGLWVFLFENRAKKNPRFNLPVAVGDIYSMLQIMNFRDVTVR